MCGTAGGFSGCSIIDEPNGTYTYSCSTYTYFDQVFPFDSTGTPLLTQFFGPGKNRFNRKLRYRRSILVLKPQNGEFENSKSTFSLVFTSVKLQLQSFLIIECNVTKRFS